MQLTPFYYGQSSLRQNSTNALEPRQQRRPLSVQEAVNEFVAIIEYQSQEIEYLKETLQLQAKAGKKLMRLVRSQIEDSDKLKEELKLQNMSLESLESKYTELSHIAETFQTESTILSKKLDRHETQEEMKAERNTDSQLEMLATGVVTGVGALIPGLNWFVVPVGVCKITALALGAESKNFRKIKNKFDLYKKFHPDAFDSEAYEYAKKHGLKYDYEKGEYGKFYYLCLKENPQATFAEVDEYVYRRVCEEKAARARDMADYGPDFNAVDAPDFD